MTSPALPHGGALRIGMVTHYMPPHIGGIETQAEELFSAYRTAGCEVTWVASRVPGSAARQDGGRVRVGCWNAPERALGVPWPVWGVDAVRAVAALARWADVLHVHDCLYGGSALAVVLARRLRKPVVLSQHIGFVTYRSALLNAVERLVYATLGRAVLLAADRVVTCTPTAERHVAALVPGRRDGVSSIPLGVDTRRFRPATPGERAAARRRFGLPPADPVILFVGRLVEKKGPHLVIEASRAMPEAHFFVVGDGPLRRLIRAGAANVTHAPFVSPAVVDLVYRAADALLLPCHSEGFPLAIVEAMASGVAVVTSEAQPLPEPLEREEGCVRAALTPAGVVEALRRLLQRPDLAGRRAARCRRLVEIHWSVDVMAARYLTLLHDVASTN